MATTQPLSYPVTQIEAHQKIWPVRQASGLVSTVDQGYDVTAPISLARKNDARQHANATLSNGKYYWPLFLTDFEIDIELAGSTAQSWSVRDFYPRNFTQPAFQVSGQALDQGDYGALCDFVLHEQRRLLSRPSQGLTQLTINPAGSSNLWTDPHTGVTVGKDAFPNHRIRGKHGGITAMGYVMSMPRQHQKSVYAPTYQFGFVVAQMLKGPWSEDVGIATQQSDWISIVKAASSITSTKANITQAKSFLDYASKHSGNVIGTGK